MHKYLIPFVLLLLFASGSTAQEKPVVLETSPPPMAAERTLVKAVGGVKLTYAKVPNESTANTSPINLSLKDGGWGSLSASFRYAGQVFQKPNTITLAVFLAAKDRTYVDNRQSVITVDGKAIFSGLAELSDGRTNGNEIYSSLRIALPLNDFKTLANGEKVTVSVGPSSWLIPVVKLSSFKDLISLADTGQ